MKKLIFILCALALLGSCSRNQNSDTGKSMQIKGSDTIVNLVQVWAERFVEQNQAANIGVTGGGSGTGFAALINNTCDIAMSSRKIEESEVEQAAKNNSYPQEFIVGLDGLIILVNKENPVNELTLEQLRGIFMKEIKNWKEVGGDDLEIVILSRESNSGTHMFFKERVLRRGNASAKDEFSVDSLLMPSSRAIFDEVYQNPHAIGYVGMGFSDNSIKVLKIAKDDDSPYIYPYPEHILSDKYPISRPLLLYTKQNPAGLIKDFIEFALSPQGQAIVLETNFVPIK